MSDKIQRIEYEADPQRCQALGGAGQCQNKAEPGLKYCCMHGGSNQVEQKKIRNYELTKLQARLERHADSPQLKSLREEIGLLRMLLETQLNKCETDIDLLTHSQSIGDLVCKVEKLVVSCHKIETGLGQVLDKTTLMTFASKIIDMLGTQLKDQPDVLDRLASDILTLVKTIHLETENE